jgi:hypothetical protein
LVREYTLSGEVISTLQTTVEGLYDWEGDLPEDLAFLRPDGDALMFAISHERDGGVSLHAAERARLLRDCPSLEQFIRWDAGSSG